MIFKRSEKSTLALVENDFNDLCHVEGSWGSPGSLQSASRLYGLLHRHTAGRSRPPKQISYFLINQRGFDVNICEHGLLIGLLLVANMGGLCKNQQFTGEQNGQGKDWGGQKIRGRHLETRT